MLKSIGPVQRQAARNFARAGCSGHRSRHRARVLLPPRLARCWDGPANCPPAVGGRGPQSRQSALRRLDDGGDGQAHRRGRSRGREMRVVCDLDRRQRRPPPRRRAAREHGDQELRAVPATGCDSRRDALEFSLLAGIPRWAAGTCGRQRDVVEARLQRAAVCACDRRRIP